MDGLCSEERSESSITCVPLAVSSADGRALQLQGCLASGGAPQLAVSSADGRALQRGLADCATITEESCSILSGWTGFAAVIISFPHCSACPLAVSSADGRALQHRAAAGKQPGPADLQYPQRMDGLCSHRLPDKLLRNRRPCSILSGWTGFAALHRGEIAAGGATCSILSGWTGFAANPMASNDQERFPCSILSGWTGFAAAIAADGWPLSATCSILSGWTGFAANIARPFRSPGASLAVSSADGRALQQTKVKLHVAKHRNLAVSSADERALQPHKKHAPGPG